MIKSKHFQNTFLTQKKSSGNAPFEWPNPGSALPHDLSEEKKYDVIVVEETESLQK